MLKADLRLRAMVGPRALQIIAQLGRVAQTRHASSLTTMKLSQLPLWVDWPLMLMDLSLTDQEMEATLR